MRKLRLRNVAMSLSIVGVAFAFCSCASVGSKFSLKDAATLDLHEQKSAELMRAFGQPVWKEIKTTKEGRFEILKFAQASPVTVRARVLLLEFRDDRLNAFMRGSSFAPDKTGIDASRATALRAGIGKLNKQDILAALGKPDGKALCPSSLGDFKSPCDGSAAEVWAWMTVAWRSHVLATTSVIVSFDAAGRLSDVQTREIEEQKDLKSTR